MTMTRGDIARLLGYAAAFDKRTVGTADAIAWHRAIGDLDYPAAEQAIVDHYAHTRDMVMPADIRRRVHPPLNDRPEAHPGYRPLTEALEAAEHGPGDLIAAAVPALSAGQDWAAIRPTDFTRRRGQPLRSPQSWRKETDDDRRKAGHAITICHGCATDIPAPEGWDPLDPDSGPLYCRRCKPTAPDPETP